MLAGVVYVMQYHACILVSCMLIQFVMAEYTNVDNYLGLKGMKC